MVERRIANPLRFCCLAQEAAPVIDRPATAARRWSRALYGYDAGLAEPRALDPIGLQERRGAVSVPGEGARKDELRGRTSASLVWGAT
jgi:hypothetical protein